MKKPFLFIISSIFISTVLFAEGPLPYRVTKTSEAYNRRTHTLITLNEGDIVYSNSAFYDRIEQGSFDVHDTLLQGSGAEYFVILLSNLSPEYYTPVKNLHPVNTENIFGEDIFVDYLPETY